MNIVSVCVPLFYLFCGCAVDISTESMVNVAPAESVEKKKTSTVLDDQHSCELVMLIT